MSDHSTIEWTDATWNPVRGCTKISPGCAHCYAEVFAERFRGVPGHPYEQGFDLRFVPKKLAEPLHWNRPKMVFVNSMSDLFHEDVPVAYIERVLRVIATANWHTYQVLTKRSERLRQLLNNDLSWAARLPHVWWGVSVENRAARLAAPRRPSKHAGGSPLSFGRAVARRFGNARFDRHSVDDRGRRKRARRPAHGDRLGPKSPRPMRRCRRALFL